MDSASQSAGNGYSVKCMVPMSLGPRMHVLKSQAFTFNRVLEK